MKAKVFGKVIGFVPENTHEAYLLGRLFEKTRPELQAGITTDTTTGTKTELIGLRFDAAELVEYLLSKP